MISARGAPVVSDGEERIKVTTLKGIDRSREPVVLLPGEMHAATGYSYGRLEALGAGENVIQSMR
jgi:hypothetical protein